MHLPPSGWICGIVLGMLAAGCAGGTRARGSVQTGNPRHDDFLRRVQLLMARVELAEEAARAPELVAPPPGMEVRITGEGPAALTVVTGAPDEETHLRALSAAERLAAAPPLMDAVPRDVDALLAEAPTLMREAMIYPGAEGNRLRSTHAEVVRTLPELRDRAQAAAGAARELLGRLAGD